MKQTISQYLSDECDRGVVGHSLGVGRMPDGRITVAFYPSNFGGLAATFLVEGNSLFPWVGHLGAPTEQELERRASGGQRLTPEQIEEAIVSEHYYVPPGTTLTICALTLRNGFMVVGKSACASPENFVADIGQRYAFEDAKRQVWELEGYALRTRLASATQKPAAGS